VRARSARRVVDDGALWSSTDRIVTAVLIGIGSLLIGIAWIGASGTAQWDTQVRWTGLAIVGAVVVCVGVGVWLYRGFTRIRTEARMVRAILGARLARPAVPTGTRDGAERVTATGMAHHHRPDCLLVAGKTVRQVSTDDDLRVCGVCG
jgi:hypothetical protein